MNRPNGAAVRAPVIRTGGGLAKRLGRMVLWLLVGVLFLRGLASVVGEREPARAVSAPPAAVAAVWPDVAAGAFAADFARAYLSFSPKDPDASARAVQAFVGPELVSTIAPQFAEDAPRQAVGAVTVARTARLDGDHGLVTVAAAVNGVSRYVTVPVARDARGGLVVSDLPSFVAGPARAVVEPAEPLALPPADRAGVWDVTTRFMQAFVGGDGGGLSYLVPAGVRVSVLSQRLQLVGVDSIVLAVPARGRERTVLVSARAKDAASGGVFGLRYRLRLVREDRWLVAGVNEATRKGR